MGFLRGFIALFATSVTLKDCGHPYTDTAVITGFGFSPLNLAPGDDFQLWVGYDLKAPITGGTATYSVTLNGIPFPSTIDALCTQTECPKAIATYNETTKATFPTGISGVIVTKIQWADQNKQPVWCLQTTFKA